MNSTLLKAVVALVPVGTLFFGAALLYFGRKGVGYFLQFLGAGCLVVVVLAHVCEGIRLFPWMHWGFEQSAGHYLDLSSAVLGLTLFPAGYLAHAIANRNG